MRTLTLEEAQGRLRDMGLRRVGMIALACVAGVTVGLGSGAAVGAVSSGPIKPVALIATILCDSAAVAAISVLLAKFFHLNGAVVHFRRIASRFALPTITLSAVMASIPVGITLERVAWLRRVDRGNHPKLRRLSVRCFTHGLCQLDRWNASPEFRSSDRSLRSVQLSGTNVTLAGARRLSAAMPGWMVECGKDQLRRY